MKTLTLSLAATLLSATIASAGGLGAVDVNGDHFASKAELATVYPGLSAADFRDLDQNDDRRISANEIDAPGAQIILDRAVASTFSDLGDIDTNGDRFASAAELAAAFPGFNTADLHEVDLNNDGRISATELYSPDAQSVISRYEDGSQILVSLDVIDTDGSGFASLSELVAEYPNLSTIDFQRFDTNDDNRISFAELYDNRAVTVLGKNQ